MPKGFEKFFPDGKKEPTSQPSTQKAAGTCRACRKDLFNSEWKFAAQVFIIVTENGDKPSSSRENAQQQSPQSSKSFSSKTESGKKIEFKFGGQSNKCVLNI